MTPVDVSGKLVLTFIMALAQYFEPVTPEQLAVIEQNKTLTEIERAVYTFQPKSIDEMMALDNNQLAVYLRTACVRLRAEVTTTQKTFLSGTLGYESTLNIVANTMNPVALDQLGDRLVPGEEFDAEQGIRMLVKACEEQNENFPIEVFADYDLKQAVQFYQDIYKDLPEFNYISELPSLPEKFSITDQAGTYLDDIFSVETVEQNNRVQVVRRNNRIVVEESEIPENLMKALVAIEDAKFWNFEPKGTDKYQGHTGIDFEGLLRAGNATASGSGLQGGSTITMQLVKNYLLYEDVNLEHVLQKRSLYRKVREYILARQLESFLSKKQILTLYLNTIDFGRNTQGIKMAAQAYFGKSPNQLELHEMAFLAALPKGPSYYNPDRHSQRVLNRRNSVLKRMLQEGFITVAEYQEAKQKSLGVVEQTQQTEREKNPYAAFYLSEVMNQLYIEKKTPILAQNNHFSTFMDSGLQTVAVESLQNGLINYERSRSNKSINAQTSEFPMPNLSQEAEFLKASSSDTTAAYIKALEVSKNIYPELKQYQRAIVLPSGQIALASGEVQTFTETEQRWVRKKNSDGSFSPLKPGDTLFIDNTTDNWKVVGFPEVTGAIIVIENNTGHVLATSSGFSLGSNQRYQGPSRNQAFHAYRQPGSTVKPFLYLDAFSHGISPSTEIANTYITFPVRYRDSQRLCNRWRPSPFSTNEPARATLSNALTHSRNLASAHLLNILAGNSDSYYLSTALSLPDPRGELRSFSPLNQALDELWDFYIRFGLYDKYPSNGPCFPSILGAEETTLARVAGAYSALANGGKRFPLQLYATEQSQPIDLQLDPIATFQLQSTLQNVVKQGTAARISKWSSFVAGKTGTTNGNKDAWFVGFTPEITVAVWVGYPEKKKLGGGSTGGRLALPIFEEFMNQYLNIYKQNNSLALSDRPKVPDNWVEIRSESRTGMLVDDFFVKEFMTYSGASEMVPTQSEYVSPDRANLSYYRSLKQDPDNQIFWQLVYENLSQSYSRRVNEAYQSFYAETIRELKYYNNVCNSTNRFRDCQQARKLRQMIPTVFQFFYHNRRKF